MITRSPHSGVLGTMTINLGSGFAIAKLLSPTRRYCYYRRSSRSVLSIKFSEFDVLWIHVQKVLHTSPENKTSFVEVSVVIFGCKSRTSNFISKIKTILTTIRFCSYFFSTLFLDEERVNILTNYCGNLSFLKNPVTLNPLQPNAVSKMSQQYPNVDTFAAFCAVVSISTNNRLPVTLFFNF